MMQQCLSSSSRSQNQLQERLSYAGNDTSKKVTVVDNDNDNDSDVDNDADVDVVFDDTPQTYVTVSRHDTG